MRHMLLVLAVLGVMSTMTAMAQEIEVAKIVGNTKLLSQPALDPAAIHECQPLKGEAVTLLQGKAVETAGVSIVHVQVLTGRCEGVQGWILSSALEVRR